MNVPSAGTARRWSRLATVALFTPTHPEHPPNHAQSLIANSAPPPTPYIPPPDSTVPMNVPSAGTARRWSRFATLPLFTPFFFNDPATTEIYTLSLHDALPISIR